MKKIKIFNIIYYTYIIIFIFLVSKPFLFGREYEELYSISLENSIVNFDFKIDQYEYDLSVDSNTINIVCDSNVEINGCNVRLDLTGKEEYKHTIKVNSKEGIVFYTLNIENIAYNELSPSNPVNKFYIKSVNGNPKEWINSDVTLEIIMSDENIYSYSFDGGVTWQDSNKFVVSENKIINIMAKNYNQETSDIKEIKIDKIDKVAPNFTIQKSGNGKSIILKIDAVDMESGIESISYNGGSFNSKSEYKISTPGKYSFKVKDKAGNESVEKQIEVTSDDFEKTLKEKKYTLTLVGNGATIEKNSYSCTTTGESCQIVLPKINSQYTVLGWGTSPTSTTAKYKQGDIISLNSDLKLYAVINKEINPMGISLNKTTLSLGVSKTEILIATISPSNATNKGVTWSSSNTSVAKVDSSGKVTGVKAGTATITAKSNNGKIAKCTVTVKSKTILVGFITSYGYLKGTYSDCKGYNSDNKCNYIIRECDISNNDTCKITAPEVVVEDGSTIVGWNTNVKATDALVKGGEILTLTTTENTRLSLITKKTVKVMFDKNGAYRLGNNTDSLTCTSYNNRGCKITMPIIIRPRGTGIGWNTSSAATSAQYKQGDTITVNSNLKLYAISKENFTVTFKANGATSIGKTSLNCEVYNNNTCTITMPSITRDGGTVIGWNTSSTATTAKYKVGDNVEISSNIVLYAITKKTYTANFYSSGLNYIEYKKKDCIAYNDDACEIRLPYFNKSGHFSSFWSTDKIVMENLEGKTKLSQYFLPSGKTYKLTENITLYPNFNSINYDTNNKTHKFRQINVSQTVTIGKSIFEFESGLNSVAISNFKTFVSSIHTKYPWLFIPGKVFVVTQETAKTIQENLAYLSLSMNDAHFTVDLFDTEGGKVISENALIHEMAHSWDKYYRHKTGSRICDLDEFAVLHGKIFNSLNDSLKKSKIETFSNLFSNYYWHILGNNPQKEWYGMNELSNEEKEAVKKFIEKYIDISKTKFQ